MLTIIKIGGKQYLVSPGQKIITEKIEKKVGEEIIFNEVLLLENGKTVKIGQPFVEKAKVIGKVVEQKKGKKVFAFKFKTKNRYKRKVGHRQLQTVIEISKIED